MTVLSPGAATLTAKLAPASYPTPLQGLGTLLATSSQLDLALLTPSAWIAQGATFGMPIAARLLSNGTPVSGATLNYQITSGVGSLSASSVQTDLNGNASVVLQVNSLADSVKVTVCVAPNNSPCDILNATMVPASVIQSEPVAGMLQVAPPRAEFSAGYSPGN